MAFSLLKRKKSCLITQCKIWGLLTWVIHVHVYHYAIHNILTKSFVLWYISIEAVFQSLPELLCWPYLENNSILFVSVSCNTLKVSIVCPYIWYLNARHRSPSRNKTMRKWGVRCNANYVDYNWSSKKNHQYKNA